MVDIAFEFRKHSLKKHHSKESVALAKEFSDALCKEMHDFVQAVVLFGSNARGDNDSDSDIDVLVVLNDISVVLTNEVLTSLRVIIQQTADSFSQNFHINTMHLSEVWDYAKQGDPVMVNILRDGISVFDKGFFNPLQLLLEQGKIRPTVESVWAYYLRAPKTLKNAQHHITQAIVDLYWAVIDASHAALMHIDVLPGAPHRIADLLDEHYGKRHLLEGKYIRLVRKFYRLAKDIGHQHILKVSGAEFDRSYIEAQDVVKRMRLLIGMDKLKILELEKR